MEALRPAASALLAGDVEPVRVQLEAHGWRFAADAELTRRFVQHLLRHLPWPPPTARDPWAQLDAEGLPPEPAEILTEPPEILTEADRLTCVLEHLACLGHRRLESDRQWALRSAPADAALDARAAALFAGMGASRYPAEIQTLWEATYLDPAATAFLAEAEADRRKPRLRRDLAEGFFLLCLGPPQETPIWRRLYARVLEQAPAGPIGALAAHIPPALHPAVARALVEQGSRAASASIAFPFRGVALRARALQAVAFGTPDGLDRLLDFHLAVRLLATWQKPGGWAPATGQAVIAQNVGRARSRLRALVAALPTLPAVEQPGLHHKTRIAVMRFFRDLARDWRARDFAMGQDTRVDAPCSLPGVAVPAVDEERQALLRTFLLRGLLLGHHSRLLRWIPTGDGAGATTFYRYLDRDLPEGLDAPRGPGGRRDYQRLRLELQSHLPTLMAALRPTLEAVARLPAPVRSHQLHTLLRPTWHPAVPLPLARPHRSVEAATQLLGPPSTFEPPLARPLPGRLGLADRGTP